MSEVMNVGVMNVGQSTQTLPEAQRTQGIESLTQIEFASVSIEFVSSSARIT